MRTKLTLLIAVLFLGTLFTMPALAGHHFRGQGPQAADNDQGWGRGQGRCQGMLEELNLTTEQQQQMQDLRTKHQKEMIPLRADLKVERIELQELIRSNAGQSEINAKIDRIGQMETSLEKKRVAHRLEMRGILTPEQQEKFDAAPRQGFGPGKRGQGRGDRGHGMRSHDCRGF